MHIDRKMTIDTPAVYKICVQGVVSTRWFPYLGGAEIECEGAPDATMTVLTGRFQDQAALLGLLNTLYDLGFPLVSFTSEYADELAMPTP